MARTGQPWKHSFQRVAVLTALLTLVFGLGIIPLGSQQSAQAVSARTNSCQLGNGIQHVIYIQFDNVHFTRDNPNVPSDLEQMPNLLNFIKGNGTLISNNHTPLIAHTANDIITSLTGVYPNKQGVPVSNSYRYFNPNGTSNSAVSFAYWTDPVFDPSTTTPTDTTFNMLAANGQNAPAPWVPYTRAGCNVGGVGTANIELENIATDIPTVFGANSPEAQEVASNPNQATADFVGIAVHCAKGNGLCSTANNGKADLLPNEPGGYTGYQALFGHKSVAPQISPNGPLTDLNGNVIQSDTGNVGFPGFDGMTAPVSLSYTAALQEHHVPVTYTYISDAHDPRSGGTAFGPGQQGYVQALASYNDAFGKFITRLAHDGINKSNTLFVMTADEGDHFVGGAPTPANCNGVTIPCTYSQIGEVDANLTGLLATEQGIKTPFKVHADSAPAIYITGNPARDNETVTRPFDQALGKLTAPDPVTNNPTTKLTNFLADSVEMNLLHMVTADPARTPTLTLFANPDYFVFAGAPNCTPSCISGDTFAWNHGDVDPQINTTWLAMVGPGVEHLGVTNRVWSDHTDIRPTMMQLLGLKDDYSHDGRVLIEILDGRALPDVIRDHRQFYTELGEAYKQINAPVGALGLLSLRISTTALESNTPNDSTYTNLENLLIHTTQIRNAVAGQMIAILEAAEFGGNHADLYANGAFSATNNDLVSQAHTLTDQLWAATRTQ